MPISIPPFTLLLQTSLRKTCTLQQFEPSLPSLLSNPLRYNPKPHTYSYCLALSNRTPCLSSLLPALHLPHISPTSFRSPQVEKTHHITIPTPPKQGANHNKTQTHNCSKRRSQLQQRDCKGAAASTEEKHSYKSKSASSIAPSEQVDCFRGYDTCPTFRCGRLAACKRRSGVSP